MNRYWLDPIPFRMRDLAVRIIQEGDVEGFLTRSSPEHGLELVWRNREILQALGLYEKALLFAFRSTTTNNYKWSLHELAEIFRKADRNKLLEAGDPLPGSGPFRIYRGVAGSVAARRVRGLSWTGDIERARWFARRDPTLKDPAVFAVTVLAENVLAYFNYRAEQDFVVQLPYVLRPVRIE